MSRARGYKRLLPAVALVAIALFMSAPSVQTHHRARLSADLDAAAQSDDARDVPVIVHGDRAKVLRIAERHGVRIKKFLRSGAVFEVGSNTLESLAGDAEIDHLSGDTPVQSALDVTAETVGATIAWSGLDDLPGLTGRGVTIAVIDSGVAAHDALEERVIHSVDFVRSGGRGADHFGHGTHVAGIIAGNGASPDGSRYRGIAPGASLINLRVLGPDGSGDTSDVVEAIDWAIEYRSRYRIRVINLSLGRPVTESYRDDPLAEAVERATAAGIVVVASAGNAGKTEDGTPVAQGIVSPGNSPYALTVGALNTRQTRWRSDDVVATYSSRGVTAIDGVLKPDLVAPGNRIVSLEAPGSALVRDFPSAHVAGSGRDAYFLMSGSSMATAVVSGAVALLLEANPSLNPLGVKAALQLTAAPVDGAGLIDAGAGSLNVVSALRLAHSGLDGDAGLDALPDAVFGAEPVGHSGIAFFDAGYGAPGELLPLEGSASRSGWLGHFVSADNKRIVWGDSKRIVWGDSKRIVWGDSKRIVWGDGTREVWGDEPR